MAEFSARSWSQLRTCEEVLQVFFSDVVSDYDCTVLEGKRDEEQQRRNVERRVSRTLNSKHVYPLGDPSRAVDVAPYPLEWPRLRRMLDELTDSVLEGKPRHMIRKLVVDFAKDLARFYYFGGYVLGRASEQDLDLRWGGDWDGDRDVHDQSFDDLVHFELRG